MLLDKDGKQIEQPPAKPQKHQFGIFHIPDDYHVRFAVEAIERETNNVKDWEREHSKVRMKVNK